jgi:hypothetical protein
MPLNTFVSFALVHELLFNLFTYAKALHQFFQDSWCVARKVHARGG